MDFNTLVDKADKAIARSDAIIQQAIRDGIINRATSSIELNGQKLIKDYFILNGIK